MNCIKSHSDFKINVNFPYIIIIIIKLSILILILIYIYSKYNDKLINLIIYFYCI